MRTSSRLAQFVVLGRRDSRRRRPLALTARRTPADQPRSRRWKRSAPARRRSRPAKTTRRSSRSQYAAENGHAHGAVEARPHVCGRRRRHPQTICAPSNISAASPTAMPTTVPARRRRALSPTPSSRSATIISTAFRRPTVKRDPERAREMFAYAASYFGDPDAQYYLGAALSGRRRRAEGSAAGGALARPLGRTRASTRRRRCSARCCSQGEAVPRQAARGLMWLTLAKDNKRLSAADQAWITKLYDSAIAAGDR